MLILLPPSEGKTAPSRGDATDLSALSFPTLNEPRAQALRALAELSSRPDALDVLGVGATIAAEVQRNTLLHAAAAAPAHRVYSGVLYEALSYRSMTPVQKRKARESIVVISALWGAVAFDDPIPAYRLSISSALPGHGRMAAFWKPFLREALAPRAAGHLVIDCRSSGYAAAYTSPSERTVTIDVFAEKDGKRSVISHFAKHHRGEFVRHLLSRRGKDPETPEGLLKAAKERWTAELSPGTGRRPHSLALILPT